MERDRKHDALPLYLTPPVFIKVGRTAISSPSKWSWIIYFVPFLCFVPGRLSLHFRLFLMLLYPRFPPRGSEMLLWVRVPPLHWHKSAKLHKTQNKRAGELEKKVFRLARQLSAVATDVREQHDATRSCCTEARLNSTRRERQTRTDYIASRVGGGGGGTGTSWCRRACAYRERHPRA